MSMCYQMLGGLMNVVMSQGEQAKWVAAVSGAIYVPFELFELYERVTWLSLGALTLNLAIVAFMLYQLFHAGSKKIANPHQSGR